MGVWMASGLEPSNYWQQVCALADELLMETPLRDWTVIVGPSGADPDAPDAAGSRWSCRIDGDAKEMAVDIPGNTPESDEGEPDAVATYIVFDLLYEKLLDGDGDPHRA